MMARGAYFTLYFMAETKQSQPVPLNQQLSIHQHRRQTTYELAAEERQNANATRGRGRSRGESMGQQGDDDDGDEADGKDAAAMAAGNGVSPFFVPAPHNRQIGTREIFMWAEFPAALHHSCRYAPDTFQTTKNKHKIPKGSRLSGVTGNPLHEKYAVHAGNYLSFLTGASMYWCDAIKLPVRPEKPVFLDDGTPAPDPPEGYTTHFPHPKRFRARYRELLSNPHQPRVKKEEQKLNILDVVDLYAGKKSFALLSNQLLALSQDCCFTVASKEASLSFSTCHSHEGFLPLPYELTIMEARIKRKMAMLQQQGADPSAIETTEAKFAAKRKRLLDAVAARQRDTWLLGFASLLSVGRNLVKHRIDRVSIADKQLKIARNKNRKRLRGTFARCKGGVLVRDAASILKTGIFVKRYWVESHDITNDITDGQQEKAKGVLDPNNSSPTGGSPDPNAKSETGENAAAPLDSVRRILHYEEIFLWCDFPNDPEVTELPEPKFTGAATLDPVPLVVPGGNKASRLQRQGGMSTDEEEELDMYGAAIYWCDPADAHLRPCNPTQALFFSSLEDIYVGKKTEGFRLRARGCRGVSLAVYSQYGPGCAVRNAGVPQFVDQVHYLLAAVAPYHRRAQGKR
jgi:hypothetical protein